MNFNVATSIHQPTQNVKTADWKVDEHNRSQLTAKQRGQLMLWALNEGCPVTLFDPLDHNEITYKRIIEVRFLPAAPGLSVTVEDDQGRLVTANGKNVMVSDAAPEDITMWDKLDIDPKKRDELLTAMRYAYTVTHEGTEYRRIEALIFRADRPSVISTSVLARSYHADYSNSLPAAQVQSTGHLLNR